MWSIFNYIDSYDRRDKPSVLVTSPGSPDIQISGKSASSQSTRYANRLAPSGPIPIDPNVGGRIQIKLGFEVGVLQLIVTIVCATGLTLRANGATRNPYIKVCSIHQWKIYFSFLFSFFFWFDIDFFIA